ncbi:ATP-binding protein [Streptomyces sp. BI20]|uniref:ATP-binding protein n=1 Tax=Streptomyces sp. BI20 TaxID=3403460 RepID=UPI003C77369D
MSSPLTTCQSDPQPRAADRFGIAYSFTLPGESLSARIARRTVAEVLGAHGLRGEYVEDAAFVAGELVASGWRCAPGEELYLSVRYRADRLRVIVYDAHARHVAPRLAAVCDARRRSRLRVVGALARERHGEHGFGPSQTPGGGTRTWVTLPDPQAAELAALAAR